MRYWFLLILVPFIVNGVVAQDCYNYHKDCKSPKTKYTYYSTENSVSFLFKSGELKEIPFDLYAGKDYRVTICADQVFNNVISFKILNSKGQLMYDNAQHDYALNLEFSSKQTQEAKLIIELPSVSDGESYKGCIGIAIEDMISVKTGF